MSSAPMPDDDPRYAARARLRGKRAALGGRLGRCPGPDRARARANHPGGVRRPDPAHAASRRHAGADVRRGGPQPGAGPRAGVRLRWEPGVRGAGSSRNGRAAGASAHACARPPRDSTPGPRSRGCARPRSSWPGAGAMADAPLRARRRSRTCPRTCAKRSPPMTEPAATPAGAAAAAPDVRRPAARRRGAPRHRRHGVPATPRRCRLAVFEPAARGRQPGRAGPDRDGQDGRLRAAAWSTGWSAPRSRPCRPWCSARRASWRSRCRASSSRLGSSGARRSSPSTAARR